MTIRQPTERKKREGERESERERGREGERTGTNTYGKTTLYYSQPDVVRVYGRWPQNEDHNCH